MENILEISIPLSTHESHLIADSLFCGKEIISLETTAESLISGIDKLEIKDNKFFILDENQDVIFIFDRTGKYITKIADIGRGPQEYYDLSDFHIDDDLIYLVAGSSSHQIMCYNLDGKFQKSFKTEYPVSRVTTDSGHIYVFYNYSHRQGHNVGVYDKKENKLIKRYKPYPKQQEGLGYDNRCWTSCNNKVYAIFPYEYNIYQLTPDTCQVIAHINYGTKYMFPKNWTEYSPQQVKNYINQTGGISESPIVGSCASLFVTPQKTIFTFVHKCFTHMCIIDRENQAIKFGIPWPDSYYWDVHALDPVYVSDEYIVRPCRPELIINYRNLKGKNPDTIAEWTLDITEEDNPCLYFYKLRK